MGFSSHRKPLTANGQLGIRTCTLAQLMLGVANDKPSELPSDNSVDKQPSDDMVIPPLH